MAAEMAANTLVEAYFESLEDDDDDSNAATNTPASNPLASAAQDRSEAGKIQYFSEKTYSSI